MDTTITIPESVTDSDIAAARGHFVESIGASYGAGRNFAGTLVAYFRTTDVGDAWITMPHDQKGAIGELMRDQRDALYADLKKAGHTNPSVWWKRIKDYAASAIKAEAVANGEADEADEADGESSGAKRTRSLQLRLIEDLTTLYKAVKKAGRDATVQQSEAGKHIGQALVALGIDISKI